MRKKHDVFVAGAHRVQAPVEGGRAILRSFLEEGISLVATQEVDPASAEKHGITGD
jgi:CxxC motif-containing protein